MQSPNKYTTDFSWINLSAARYLPAIKHSLAEYRKAMELVKAIPNKERTFENTVVAIEFSSEKFATLWQKINFLLNVTTIESTRKLAKEAVDYAEEQMIEIQYDEDIFKAFTALEKKKPKLFGADKKLFSDTMLNYRRLGFGLSKAKRNQVKNKFQRMAKLGSDFRKNINDYKDAILVTKEELAGLPESYINGLNKIDNHYQVGLSYPDYVPFMENAHNESKRAELARKYLRKGGKQNMVVLKEMVKLRDEVAKLLGYKNHAAFVLEVNMAKNPESVFKFLNSLITPLQKKLKVEMAELQQLKSRLTKNPHAKLAHYDQLYLMNQDKKQRHSVDDELVREYFPLEVVTKGLFEIYQKLLSVRFKRVSNVPTWHPDVQAYEVHEPNGKLIAHFFLDMFPRKGKYGHAAVFPIIPGMELPDGSYQKSLVSMVCNFSKPTRSRPSLLSHDEVNTYFHEFGHVVHGVLTNAKHVVQSGTSVDRDFVEAPSQMLENWVWDAQMLQILSGHYKNPKKKLPKELLRNMLRAKNHMISYHNMRQITLGTFDMTLHTNNKVKDIAMLYTDLCKKLIGVDLPKDQIFPAGFGHLDGYDAGYYGYLWSQVYAADMFTRFKESGLLNSKVGKEYRKFILEPGSSKEAIELVKKFLGRKPNNKAFLKGLGL